MTTRGFAHAVGMLYAAWCLAVVAAAQTAATLPADAPAAPSVLAPAEPRGEGEAPAEPAAPPPAQPRPAETSATSTAGPPRNILDLYELTLELGLEASYDQREVRYDRRRPLELGYEQDNRDWRLEETLGARMSGALWDEKVALFDVSILGGLSQERFTEDKPGRDLGESPDGDLLEYDLQLTLLPRGRISGTAYAQRLDSRIPRAFQPSLDRTRERYGGTLLLNDEVLPMRLRFEHVWDALTSRTRELVDDEQRGDDTFEYEATWNISRRHTLRLTYEYNDRQERYSGSRTQFDTTRNYLVLDHNLRFGRDERSSWQNLARVQDETGELAHDLAELASRLRLQHTDSFATNYAVQYLRDSYFELTTEMTRGEVGFTHQLADALTSTVQLWGLRQQADDNADYTEWGGLANLAYTRPNALGRFSANLAYNHISLETDNGERRGVVVAESVTFRDPLSSYLAQQDVVLTTLVVTDASRTRIYLPGRDWIAVPVGHFTALRRVASGEIADRQTVLVSYTYDVQDDYDLARDRIDFRIQQEFKGGLTPYYAASIQNENLDRPELITWRARNVNRHRLGLTYRQPRWSAGGEYEYNDDTIDPYQALHANGDAVLWQKGSHQLDGKLALSLFDFSGSGDLRPRDARLFDLGAEYRVLLARDLEASAAAMFRYEDDTLYGLTRGVDLSAAVDWKIGYFALRFEAEYDLLDLPGSRDDSFAVWIKLRREIPVIARAAQ